MKLDDFTLSYIETALWSSTEETEDGETFNLDESYSYSDLSPEALAQIVEDCKAFQESMAEWLTDEHCDVADVAKQAGHDFWLTRNRHGAGFWDGDWSDESEKALTECSHGFGECTLYIGDDGKIYIA